MGSDTSSNQEEETPTVAHIFSCGPHFDPDLPTVEQEAIVFPFEKKDVWAIIVEKITAPTDSSQSAILNLQTLFQSLTDHLGRRFCQHLKELLGVAEKQEFAKCFLEETIPFMKKLILKMPELLSNHGLQFMIPKIDKVISLKRKQIASILAGCFFDLVEEHCRFGHELSSCGVPGKFDSYMHYFEYVRQKGLDSDWAEEEVIIYRRCLQPKNCHFLEHKALSTNVSILCNVKVFDREKPSPPSPFVVAMEEMKRKEDALAAKEPQTDDNETKTDDMEEESKDNAQKARNERIEDCFDGIHADFANMFIGGGVLSGGNVQEEIRFTVNLECLISKLLCPHPMQNDEAIIILKSQQFCDYEGYGARFSCTGLVPREEERHKSVIIGIDAVNFMSRKRQYKLKLMMREVCKAYVGFSVDTVSMIQQRLPIVATGNWGCGMFGGDPQFKAMLQWIAATLVEREVWYYTFSDKRVEKQLKVIVDMMLKKRVTVGQLWKILNTKRSDKDQRDVFDIIKAAISK
eukprot:123680_1